jgi:transposase-like protein
VIVEKVKRLKTLGEFDRFFKDEEICREFLEEIRWKGEPRCPSCDCTKVYRYKKGHVLRCASCTKAFTVIKGTIFEKTRVPLDKWFSAIYHVKNEGQGPRWIEDNCGVSHKTAWFMFQRIVQMSQINFDDFVQFNNVIAEVDETYIGPDKAKQSTKRIRELKSTIKGGVGDRISFTTVYVRGKGVFCLLQPPYVTAARNKQIVTSMLDKTCTVYCDQGKHFKWMMGYFKDVKQFDHSKRQFVDPVNKSEHSQSVEGFFKHLKEYLDQFPTARKKYIQRYVSEFAWSYSANNFCDKKLSTGRKMTRIEKFLEAFKNVENLQRPITLNELKGRDKDEKMINEWREENRNKQIAAQKLKIERKGRKELREIKNVKKEKLRQEYPNGRKRGRKSKQLQETCHEQ